MGYHPISAQYRRRIISSLVYFTILGILFSIILRDYFGNFIIYYAIGVSIYLALVLPRYYKMKQAEESAMKLGDSNAPIMNPAANQYPNILGQPAFYQPRNQNLYGHGIYRTKDDIVNNMPLRDKLKAVSQKDSTDKTETETIICLNCNNHCTHDSVFCDNCGIKLK